MTDGSTEQGRRGQRAAVLRKRTDFETVLRLGIRLSSRNFVLRAHPNAVTHARLGIIAAGKVAPRAVDRNRGKRRIREVFRAHFAALGACDIIVQLRNNLRQEENDAMRAELRRLLQLVIERAGDSRAISQRPGP